MPAAAPAIPPKPKIAAMIAMTTNVIVQRNIIYKFLVSIFNDLSFKSYILQYPN